MLASARALRALPRTRPLAAARRAPALARPFTAATPRLEPLNGGSASYAEAMLEEWKQVRTLSSHSRPPSSRRRPRLPRARSEKAGPRRERESDHLTDSRLSRPQDPTSVHASWRAYFELTEGGLPASQAFQAPPIAIGDSMEGPAPVLLNMGGGGQIEDHMKVRPLSLAPRRCAGRATTSTG